MQINTWFYEYFAPKCPAYLTHNVNLNANLANETLQEKILLHLTLWTKSVTWKLNENDTNRRHNQYRHASSCHKCQVILMLFVMTFEPLHAKQVKTWMETWTYHKWLESHHSKRYITTNQFLLVGLLFIVIHWCSMGVSFPLNMDFALPFQKHKDETA